MVLEGTAEGRVNKRKEPSRSEAKGVGQLLIKPKVISFLFVPTIFNKNHYSRAMNIRIVWSDVTVKTYQLLTSSINSNLSVNLNIN